jgi:hypothetical protein
MARCPAIAAHQMQSRSSRAPARSEFDIEPAKAPDQIRGSGPAGRSLDGNQHQIRARRLDPELFSGQADLRQGTSIETRCL